MQQIAVNSDNFQAIREILKDPRVDPSAKSNAVFCTAADKGRSGIVVELLHDTRVDPAANNNFAIR